MIPFFTLAGSIAYLALAFLTHIADPDRRVKLATVALAVGVAILLNSLGNLDGEWPTALLWMFIGVPVSVWSLQAARRDAARTNVGVRS